MALLICLHLHKQNINSTNVPIHNKNNGLCVERERLYCCGICIKTIYSTAEVSRPWASSYISGFHALIKRGARERFMTSCKQKTYAKDSRTCVDETMALRFTAIYQNTLMLLVSSPHIKTNKLRFHALMLTLFQSLVSKHTGALGFLASYRLTNSGSTRDDGEFQTLV